MADRKKVMTPVFRGSFLNVLEAASFDGGAPKFDITAIFDPAKFTPRDKQRWADMIGLADDASKQAFGKPVKQLPANFKKPFRDGAEKSDLDGFEDGKPFARLSSKMKPGIVDINGNDILDPQEIYPGAYYRATVTAYAYDNKGKGVAFGLNNLQKIADGERLDARTDAGSDFAGDAVDDHWLDGSATQGGSAPDPLDDETPF